MDVPHGHIQGVRSREREFPFHLNLSVQLWDPPQSARVANAPPSVEDPALRGRSLCSFNANSGDLPYRGPD
jgi:hypothetical protein